jgi:hypothetical protein
MMEALALLVGVTPLSDPKNREDWANALSMFLANNADQTFIVYGFRKGPKHSGTLSTPKITLINNARS